MKLTNTKIAAAIAAGTLAFASAPAHAGAMAMSDLNITSLFLANALGPIPQNAGIAVISESRTGTANANYNGVVGTGAGAGSITSNTVGATVDVKARCAGPDCGVIAGALYGGSTENNTTANVTPPPSANYALGDMYISGSAVGGAVSGLTRADAAATGPNNEGGSNSTILNSATTSITFGVGATVSASVAVTASAYQALWVSNAADRIDQASAGMGWTMTLRCISGNCAGFSTLFFSPDEINQTGFVTDSSDNLSYSFAGTVLSDSRTFRSGNTYSLSINQSTNATVVSKVPEPAGLALAGVALLGLGLSTRRRAK